MQAKPFEVQPLGTPPFAGFLFETPASLGCIYKLVPGACFTNPNVATVNPTGGARAIGIVDAFHYPTALSDLKTFSTQFGLPAPNLQVVFGGGSQPAQNAGFQMEEALDIEWAHAMAPKAKIILVEATTNSSANLLQAEDKAATLVAAAGDGEVSNSFGGSEFPGETSASFDGHFKKAGIVYFASTGDSPGTEWPAVSPFVVAAGGTSTTHNLTTGDFYKEVAWQDEGSGISEFESRPTYQNSVAGIVGTHRGTPDISFDSNPATGVWVFATIVGSLPGWYIVGGTSLASPALAGIVNSAGLFKTSTALELTTIYANKANPASFRDITLGNCGPFGGFFAAVGYDLCSGVGSDQGKTNK